MLPRPLPLSAAQLPVGTGWGAAGDLSCEVVARGLSVPVAQLLRSEGWDCAHPLHCSYRSVSPVPTHPPLNVLLCGVFCPLVLGGGTFVEL